VLCKRRLWKWASLYTEAPLEDLEARFIYQGLREIVQESSGNGASLSMGAVLREPGGSAPLLDTIHGCY
jgi:hypothetical protein